MEKVFKGYRYNFRVINFPSKKKKKNAFAIEAMYKKARRISCITNVNVILSALEIDPYKHEFWGSDWLLNKNVANKLMTRTEQFLSDRKFLPHVEKYLDLDRKEGEWNTIISN